MRQSGPDFLMLLLALVMLSNLIGCDGGFIGKPAAPLRISWRPSLLDPDGLVLQVTNTSDHSLSCRLIAKNKTLNEAIVYTFELGPRDATEIGILEAGWSFRTGERVWIQVKGFATKSFYVP